jgi:hypothetical protein
VHSFIHGRLENTRRREGSIHATRYYILFTFTIVGKIRSHFTTQNCHCKKNATLYITIKLLFNFQISMLSTSTRCVLLFTRLPLAASALSSSFSYNNNPIFSFSSLPNKPITIIHKPIFTTLTPLSFTLRTDHTMASQSNPQSIHDFTVKVIYSFLLSSSLSLSNNFTRFIHFYYYLFCRMLRVMMLISVTTKERSFLLSMLPHNGKYYYAASFFLPDLTIFFSFSS